MSSLTITASEESTLVINYAFTDEDSVAATPVSATWTLSDCEGAIINNREDVTIASLSTSIDIVVSGDDLAMQSANDDGHRVFLVKGTYNSTLGSGLPFTDQCDFFIEGFVGIT